MVLKLTMVVVVPRKRGEARGGLLRWRCVSLQIGVLRSSLSSWSAASGREGPVFACLVARAEAKGRKRIKTKENECMCLCRKEEWKSGTLGWVP